MSDLHWNLREILKEFRPDGRLNVFTCILLHKNNRNRSWPSNELIHKETGFSLAPISASIGWLLESYAMVLVPYDKRVGKEKSCGKNKNIYQMTGVIRIGDEYHQYWSMNPESWEAVADDLSEIGDNLLSELSNSPDNSLGKYLLSKRKGIDSNALDSKDDKRDTASPSTSHSNSLEEIPPSGKRKQERSGKSTPLQMWLERLPAVKSVVCALLTACYDGWDNVMMSPENSLTVQQLEKYITNAEEYVRLGGMSHEVGQVYEFIGDVDYTIAPQTIAGFYLRWKSQQQFNDLPAVKQIDVPVKTMTDSERAVWLAKIKADKAVLFS